MRFGLDAKLITSLEGEVKSLRDDIFAWCDRISKTATELGYDRHFDTLRRILAEGNSSMRQREVFAKTGSLQQVVAHNIAEFESGHPLWNGRELACDDAV